MVDLPILLLVTILVIYMVLAILYEHFIHPITILTALPLAMVGALLSLLLFGQELNIFSFVGLIMLVGLVKKNGIIMVDFALQMRREKGLSARDAIIEACLVRFRPIMMTTMAAILGTLPIALGLGMGAEARRPLGHRHGGRPALLPDADPVPHARLLRGHGTPLEPSWHGHPIQR